MEESVSKSSLSSAEEKESVSLSKTKSSTFITEEETQFDHPADPIISKQEMTRLAQGEANSRTADGRAATLPTDGEVESAGDEKGSTVNSSKPVDDKAFKWSNNTEWVDKSNKGE